ncbi:ABC transporter substrate-binding protein [Georgenia wutianyii]|uniref:ABC transporter substrate-binding protein n=1 Tax=Georgenia wutianyii TaxID=2585135 RepID=A0ABX5VJ09_9MICO|nr:ABC transporter substrate-binding protein [Georgenia wutianyii]QDB78364.1 ABC transporter substrate-binding protein [Georgenia wutianyii]
MKKHARVMVAALAVTSFGLAACSGDGDDGGDGGETTTGTSTGVVSINGTEPQNPLIPTDTNEVGGGDIVDLLFAGLVRYESDGTVVNEVAESIETEDNQNFTITIEDGWTFSDGTPVTAQSFVDAWNYGALLSNQQNSSYFFESIEGFSLEEDSELTGLEVVDDLTFTVALTQPEFDFPLRLGYAAYYPLPESAFEDMEAFGESPVGNGPYMLAGPDAWEHNVQIELVPNEEYAGDVPAQNGGARVVFYDNLDTAYNDLIAGNLDVMDEMPSAALATFEEELGDRAVNQPAALNQTLGVPSYLPQFAGEAGLLRRQAISLAIDREQIAETIFAGTVTPAVDYTVPSIEGFTPDVPGNAVTQYDPELAAELWAQAEAIEPWEGTLTISSNADGDHQAWIDAVNNSIRNTLGIDAEFEAYPQFSEFLDARDNQEISGLFRAGWQADWPSLVNFLAPIYVTGAGSNDAFYSNPDFDEIIREINASETLEQANALVVDAQAILFEGLPGIPLWVENAVGGYSEDVDNVEFAWNRQVDVPSITKN